MSVKSSTNKFSLDALLVLEPAGSANITATGVSASSIELDVLTAYWQTGDIAVNLDVAVVLEVTVWDHTTGDETYVATVEVAPTSGFGAPVTVATQAITGLGRYVMVIDRDEVQNALGTSATDGFLRVKQTLAGTTPILNYSAFVAPLPGL
jgi:hypothetical protein